MYFSSGYATGYAQDKVKEVARKVADCLAKKPVGTCVVVRGTSGVSAGFAALMLQKFYLFLVRKGSENSHGCPIEGPGLVSLGDYYILDDLIDTGSTVAEIIRAVELAHEQNGVSWENIPRCHGIILYNTCRVIKSVPYESVGAPISYNIPVEVL